MDGKLLLSQAKALLENERNLIPNLANLSALIWERMDRLNWAGFYLVKGEELLLGPFQGKPACIHIPLGKGVCGTAAARKETVIVPDVHKFPDHIACDSASCSEIVVPLLDEKNEVLGVLDIDSPFPARFCEEDARILEQLARLIIAGCDWT